METTTDNKSHIVYNEAAIQAPPEEPVRSISNFWRRIFAFWIDFLILAIFGAFLGIFFADFFQSIGGFGRFIGLGIAIVYFGILNSKLAGGQTFGKRILGIRVVNKTGDTIKPVGSFQRAFILLLPAYMNGLSLPCGVSVDYFVMVVLIFIIFGMGLSIIYLYVFNVRTRQSLHDLIAGTYVVYSGSKTDLSSYITPKKHFVIGGMTLFIIPLAIIMFINPVTSIVSKQLYKSEKWRELVELTNLVMAEEPCIVTKVSFHTNLTGGEEGKNKTNYISVNATVTKSGEDEKMVSARIAKLIAIEYKGIKRIDGIKINTVKGYDIGIFQFTIKDSHTYDTRGYHIN